MKVIALSLEPKQNEKLTDLAKQYGIPKSAIGRYLINVGYSDLESTLDNNEWWKVRYSAFEHLNDC